MITLKEYTELLEAFDKPYRWRYNSGNMEYIFDTDTGLEYYASLNERRSLQSLDGTQYHEFYEFKFSFMDNDSSGGEIEPTKRMAGKNDPRVFATIVDILKDVTKKPFIDILDVTGSSEKRTTLYTRMIEKLLPRLNSKFRFYKTRMPDSLYLIRKSIMIDETELRNH